MKYTSKAKTKFKKRKSALDPLRAIIKPLLIRANQLVSQLKQSESGLASAAYQEALRSLRPSKREAFEKGEEPLFTDTYTRARELSREASRIKKFLSSQDITPRVAEAQQRAIDAKLKHHISFHDQGASLRLSGVRFMGVEQDRFKLAAKIYRHVEESATNIYGGYGSDNLINLIYNELEGYDPNTMPEDSDLYNRLMQSVEEDARQALLDYKKFVEKQYLEGNPIDEIDVSPLDSLEHITNADEFFKRRNF